MKLKDLIQNLEIMLKTNGNREVGTMLKTQEKPEFHLLIDGRFDFIDVENGNCQKVLVLDFNI